VTDDAALAHDPLDALTVDPPAAAAQLRGDARRAIRGLVFAVDGADLGGQLVSASARCARAGRAASHS
jgi:hypothetical protein